MPYKSEKIKIQGTMLDRRRRLTDDQKENIKNLYKSAGMSMRALSREFKVSRATIKTLVDPEFAERRKQYIKDNWKKYQVFGEEHNEIIKKTRKYKQELYLKGLINEVK